MRVCWNRQTGTFEGRVSLTYGFKSRHSHHKNCTAHFVLCNFCFCFRVTGLESPLRKQSGITILLSEAVMSRFMRITAFLTVAAAICFFVVYHAAGDGVFLTLAIMFGTIAYHFCMRLSVGLLFNIFMNNKADYTKPWFVVGKRKQKLYQWLKVKKWKRFMPTFDPKLFDPAVHSWDEIAQAMCQAELVHETIVVLSFLPIISSVWFGDLAVFIITSVLAALLDLIFVIMQRYNRPRVIRLIKHQSY